MRTLLILLLLASPASAHKFFSTYCCEEKDCQPVACDKLIELPSGDLALDNTQHVFPKAHVYPTEDGQCYACIWNGTARCAYILHSY